MSASRVGGDWKYMMLLSLFPRELRKKIWKVTHLNPTTSENRVREGIGSKLLGLEIYDALIFIPKGIKKKDMGSNTPESHDFS